MEETYVPIGIEEYVVCMYHGILIIKKNEFLLFVTTWMDLGASEVTQC